jgi:hypothetical protein
MKTSAMTVLPPAMGKSESEEYPDPNDYDNDTDYLNAIPGMREKIIAGLNTPLSECEPIPAELFDV